jgi:hypothetical protein
MQFESLAWRGFTSLALAVTQTSKLHRQKKSSGGPSFEMPPELTRSVTELLFENRIWKDHWAGEIVSA